MCTVLLPPGVNPIALQYGKDIATNRTKFNVLAMRWWNTERLTTTCFGIKVGHHQVTYLLTP